MAILYISEYTQQQISQPTVGTEPSVANQAVTFTGTPGQSAAFRSDTKMVRIHPDGICSIKFGTNPTAATTDARMVAGQTEYFLISPGYKISAITNT